MFDRIKDGMVTIVKSRLSVIIIAFVILFAVLIQRVFYLQIIKGQSYLDDYKLSIQKTREVQGTRGKIRDCNGNVLAYNKLAYSVTIEDNGSYNNIKEKNKIVNQTVTKIIQIVESHEDTVISDFGIVINAMNQYEFTTPEGIRRLRFIADIYGYPTIDKLSPKQRNSSAQDIMNYLCEDKVYGYGIDQKKIEKKDIIKLVNIRYAMGLNSFQKYIPTTIASDVSEESVADIMENSDVLQGVDVVEDSLRHYNDSKYFASLIGYTGKISEDELTTLNEEKKKYSLTDIVGKAGLEQSLDSDLQGKKGKKILYVDSVGKIIETAKGKDASAGNDVWLTIDKDLQIATYRIIEEKLAGIVLSRMQNVMNYDRTSVSKSGDIIIPIDDVYNAFFSNSILDKEHFKAEDAKENEQAVYAQYNTSLESSIAAIMEQLNNANASPYSELSKEMQAYMSYIATDILTNETGIIQKDKIDTSDKMYIAWKEEDSLSLYEYLNFAISKNWVDASALQQYVSSEETYADSKELYQGILSFLGEYLKDNSGFEKLVYKYMIKNGTITGKQICLMLYEQGVLQYDETQFNNLVSGATGPYDFIRGKIETLEITPAQLALEPCTGSAVVTDVNTGAVLACVSYPGYDNNRLANTMDSKYYNQLVHDMSRPLYNHATQEKTAPGSTYKMVSAIAGLTEGVINLNTQVECTGTYDRIEPNPPKCWIYPHSHGSLNVVGGIENSCNIFFYETGYRLGLKPADSSTTTADTKDKRLDTSYSSDLGIQKLNKYSQMFGLGEKSGLEIPEVEPEISTEYSIPSAIGQGTNNYTVSQLARYVTAVANKENVYDLTLLKQITDVKENVVKTYEPTVYQPLEDISNSTWNAVHEGMKAVIKSKASFANMREQNFTMSGKTGTAQQSKTHPDHGLFVGFAPSDAPEIALSVRITNGYSSSYAAEIGRDIVMYRYKLASDDTLFNGMANSINNAVVSGD
ncbi:MAG: penicillin-binding transpeptidase domain-containing protein [Lachnospiraceae bacterium]